LFYQALLEIFEVYEEWSGKKVFIKNILKDLELLPQFENFKNEFVAIGILEKTTIKLSLKNLKNTQRKLDMLLFFYPLMI